jgi:hypothetical protein
MAEVNTTQAGKILAAQKLMPHESFAACASWSRRC